MPDYFQVDDIVVTAPSGGGVNAIMDMWLMIDLVTAEPTQIIIVVPRIGVVDGHQIVVKWGGLRPPLKPELADNQVQNLLNSYIRVGNVVKNMDDGSIYKVGSATMTGKQVKEAYFALKTIEVTEDVYQEGYGEQNLGDTLRIGYTTSAGWGRHGDGGYNFIMIHEAIHNSTIGRAIVQQNYDRHQDAVENGSLSVAYGLHSPHFRTQEAMTNLLTKQMGDQIGVNINSSSPESTGYPTYGYYSGDEFTRN